MNSEKPHLLVDFSGLSIVKRMKRSEECRIGQEKREEIERQREQRPLGQRWDSGTPPEPGLTQDALTQVPRVSICTPSSKD